MTEYQKQYYEKRGQVLVKNLNARHFEAYYCANREEALKKALDLIPVGATVGWGGAMSAEQIGLLAAVKAGNYSVIDRDAARSPEERNDLMRQCLLSDVFLSGANALSLDGQMVNVDGNGNRVAAIVYGPKSVIVVAGMNKVVRSAEDAYRRARYTAAPENIARLPQRKTPCAITGTCSDCLSDDCICSQIVCTRRCNPPKRIKVILIGEDLGL